MSRLADDLAEHAARRFGEVAQQALNLIDDEEEREYFLVQVAIGVLLSAAKTLLTDTPSLERMSDNGRGIVLVSLIRSILDDRLSVQERSDLIAANDAARKAAP